jgi:GTP cyclohydrolase II
MHRKVYHNRPMPAFDAATKTDASRPDWRLLLQPRAVRRAAAELRRGAPVLLDGDEPLVLVAAEVAEAAAVCEFEFLAARPWLVLLAPGRASAVLHRPVADRVAALALRVSVRTPSPEFLHAIADPIVSESGPGWLEAAPAPALAPAALALSKLSRLLPAMLAGSPRRDRAEATENGLVKVAAADVLAYPAATATALRRVAEARLPLDAAQDARLVAFRSADAGIEHFAILVGDPESAEAPLVRIHSECFTGDLLGSLRCDCGPQLRGAIRRMADEGAGALLYLAQEGRGIGLVNKLRAYALQDRGLDTLDANRALGWDADERDFLVAATMLEALNIRRIRLLTNNPRKLTAIASCGIDVVRREPLAYAPNGVNDHYLATKAQRFGHLLG